jgi:hypothetical protein
LENAKVIPKLFHQIWINESQPELPEPYRSYAQTWLDMHPGWAYRLWNVANIDFPLRRPELLPLCGSYAQKADVLRLEVVFRYGGVYMDTDFECFKPLEPVLAGVDEVFCAESGQAIANSFFAAMPGSPVLLRLLDALPLQLGGPYPNLETGPGFFTEQILLGGFDGNVRLLPTRLLFPYAAGEARATASSHPEAFGAHHWAHSWASSGSTRAVKRRIQETLFHLARRLS